MDRKSYCMVACANGAIAALYHLDFISINIPWLPVSVIGTVIAFYVGFKNNQAYNTKKVFW